MQKETYLVVISILEGRNFPSRAKHQLVIECRFDGELLSTDAISHTEQPDFTTELAWEMDRKALHQHRMQRTPVKLQCFAVEASTKVREMVGYVVLDLRGLQLKSQAAKWYPLLSSKYSRLKPALRLAMQLENDAANDNEQTFKAQDAPPRTVPSHVSGPLTAQLNAEEGYFQIGNDKNCEIFVLSVTLGTAHNLEQLIDGDTLLPSVTSGYFFYYSLFGSDITSESFQDLLSPNITPERASIRLRTTMTTLRSYLTQQTDNFTAHLCCGDHVLGSASIPFAGLFSESNLDRAFESAGAQVDGHFVLEHQEKRVVKVKLPTVHVNLTLRTENVTVPKALPQNDKEFCHTDDEAAPNDDPVRDTDQLPKPNLPPPPPESIDDVNSIPSDNVIERDVKKPPMSDGSEEVKTWSSLTTTDTHTGATPITHHFRVTLNLKTIGKLELPQTCNLFVKYSYPFFGSFAPVMTVPVQVKRHAETIIPRSMCVFDFACTIQMLTGAFKTTPLHLEVWHRNAEAKDVLLGGADLTLAKVLSSPHEEVLVKRSEGDDVTAFRQKFSGKLPVITNAKKRIAEISLYIMLEDLGVARDHNIVHQSPEDRDRNFARPPDDLPKPTKPTRVEKPPAELPAPVSVQQQDVRESDQYKSAIELELWKSQEKENFTKRLKEVESEHLKLLTEEFKNRDKSREVLVAKRIQEYQELEKQITDSISGLEDRERAVSAKELELAQMCKEAERERERNLTDSEELVKRMKEDCLHQIQLEKNRRLLLEDHNQKLSNQVSELEAKYAALTSEYYQHRNQDSARPEIRLEAELNLARLEKADLERKLETAVKSKLHYKQQWGRTLKELALMRKREQEQAMASLKQQQLELAQIKLQSATDRQASARERDRAVEVEKELNLLRRREKEVPTIAYGECSRESETCCDRGERVQRLMDERDTLLRTGVYTRSDRIISELDRQINELIGPVANG